jgi:hypothetical protein
MRLRARDTAGRYDVGGTRDALAQVFQRLMTSRAS